MNKRIGPCFFTLFALTAILLPVGCGPSRPTTVPVRGRVLLDGDPIEGAAVMFVPKAGGRPANGVTDADGRFILETFGIEDGAIKGEHIVTVCLVKISNVTAAEGDLSGEVGEGGIQEDWIVPKRYAQIETSGLHAKVERGMEPVVLRLESTE